MTNPTNTDPLEGKGEEMIPERGLPFDDIDETPLEDIPPEERIPDFPEGDPPAFELEAIPEDNPMSEANGEPDEPGFELSEKETEALLGEAVDAFEMEASPWSMEANEADVFVGEASEAFSPSEGYDSPIDDPEPAFSADEEQLEDEFEAPPMGFSDEGMSTHREDSPEEIGADPTHSHLFSAATTQPPGPVIPHAVHKHDNIQHAGEEPNQPMIDLLVTNEAMEALWRRADQAQKDIKRHIHTLHIARPMLDQVQAGRNELMAGKTFYEEAERHIAEAEYRVQLSIQLEKWSKTLIPRLFYYLTAWFVLLIVATFALGENLFSSDAPLLFILAGSMIFGGVGGIIGAVLPLIKHYSEKQDFSKRYTTWYIYSPFIGVAMGSIIFVIMSAGVFSISAGSTSISLPYLIYIVAGMAGYQHNVFTGLVKRMLKVLEFNNGDAAEAPVTNDKLPPPTDSK
jgi:hypothetical protein